MEEIHRAMYAERNVDPLEQGSPTPGPWTTTGPGRTAGGELQASERKLHLSLPIARITA